MIELKNAFKSFSEKKVLSDINLEVNTGECFAIIGANGSGKSTLINGLLGLLDFDKGSLFIDGKTYLINTNEIRKTIGCIPEKSFLIESFTGFEFLYYHGLLLFVEKELLKVRIKELIELFFEDSTVMYAPISSYSFGMKKRLEICASLINSPSILIYDEPFNGLDPLFCKVFIDVVKELMALGKKIIISSHDLDYVKDVSTNIVMLADSKSVFSGKKEDFFNLGQSNLDVFFNYLPKEKHNQHRKKIPEWI